jgi:hypothetical protein
MHFVESGLASSITQFLYYLIFILYPTCHSDLGPQIRQSEAEKQAAAVMERGGHAGGASLAGRWFTTDGGGGNEIEVRV